MTSLYYKYPERNIKMHSNSKSLGYGLVRVLVLFLGFNGFLSGSLAVAGCCSALEYSRQDSTTT